MKNAVKAFIKHIVRNNSAWNALNSTIVPAVEYAKWQRKLFVNRKTHERNALLTSKALQLISPDLIVRHGPFKGMIYPVLESVGSALIPKLLGSYENELHSIFDDILSKNYTDIIDVGCAEGYYAVGFARRFSAVKIYAYDTDARAVDLCTKMAQVNNVADRFVMGSLCTSETLEALPLSGQALIICDCEGYEKSLFTEETIPVLAKHDLLIETHDFIDIEISSLIRKRFKDTHRITSVQSVDDIVKAQTYSYPELESFTLSERRLLLAEYRPSIMTWLFMTPK